MARKLNGPSKRKLKRWVLRFYGNGTVVACFRCGISLNYTTVTLDRIRPGALGGTYRQNNVRPACRPCNLALGKMLEPLLKELRPGGKLPTDEINLLPNWWITQKVLESEKEENAGKDYSGNCSSAA